MTLPQINIQRYPIHLACSKRDVEFRPFTVGEEKILLSIIESKGEGEEFEIKDFVTAFTQILTECTFNKVDISKLPTFDVEHLFIRIREISVGTDVKISATCAHCEEKNIVNIKLSDIEDPKPLDDHNRTIMLDPSQNIGIKMKYPEFSTLSNLKEISDTLQIIIDSVDCVFQGENVTYLKDEPKEAVEEWFSTLTKEHVNKIKHFFETTPRCRLPISFKCSNCGEMNEGVSVEGLMNFFS